MFGIFLAVWLPTSNIGEHQTQRNYFDDLFNQFCPLDQSHTLKPINFDGFLLKEHNFFGQNEKLLKCVVKSLYFLMILKCYNEYFIGFLYFLVIILIYWIIN